MGKRHYDGHACPKISIYLGARNVVSWYIVLIDFSLTVKAATLIFISGRGTVSSSAKEGKSGFFWVHNVCLYVYVK